MEIEAFPKNYQKKRSARKRRIDFYSQISSLSSGEWNNTMRYYVRVKANSLVFEDPGNSSLIEERDLLNLGDVSAEGTSKRCQGTASSSALKCVLLKGRKRKTKRKEESSDSEIPVPHRIRFCGQAKRGRIGCKKSIIWREKLDSGTFLHYLTHIWNAFSEEKVKSFAFFDPIWFNLYADEKSRVMVLNWVREIDTFSKKYVLVPIVLWSHWSLLIFCHLDEDLDSKNNTPCMLLLDSLHSIGPKRLEPLIRRFLFDIYKLEGRKETITQLKNMRLFIPKVPQQKKGEECGYLVLYYIHLFIESAPENFSAFDGYPYFMKKDWFTSEALESFYKRLESFPAVVNDHDDSASFDSGDCVEMTFVK